jgi:exodeoxyribonuclease V alpha subunit
MIELSALDTEQRQAVEVCCGSSRLAVVTGPAGTGKTTIIRLVSQTLTDNGYRVALAAPTGKAAKRISEATGLAAMTIHRLLKFSSPGDIDPETGKRTLVPFPRRHRGNPLEYDVVIIDEYAMVPTGLHRQVIDALSPGAKLRSFGDVNQLPPIENDSITVKESPFKYLLRCGDFPTVTLSTIHRHGEGSAIVQNGIRILRGSVPVSSPGSFSVKVSERPLADLTTMLYKVREGHGGDGLFNGVTHQIICPQRVGKLGSMKLNLALVDLYKEDGRRCVVEASAWDVKKGLPSKTVFQVGQKVINTQNMYDLRPTVDERYDGGRLIHPMPHEEVFNGETGIITDILGEDITVDLGDRAVCIPAYLEYLDDRGMVRASDARKHLEHAYVVTTHKAQGSEFEGVIYFITSATAFAQCRANFYTGITRARSQVVVMADRMSLTFYSLKPEAGFPKR